MKSTNRFIKAIIRRVTPQDKARSPLICNFSDNYYADQRCIAHGDKVK